MILFARELKSAAQGFDGAPLVILHGLLGSSRNWVSTGQAWPGPEAVYALDLRNHGQSFHADIMPYRAMAQDVLAWTEERGLAEIHLIGHSMGGKVAMRFALDFSEHLASLTIVDIAPVTNPPYHRREVEAMVALDLASASSRREIETALSEQVGDWAMRQFLLTNLKGGGSAGPYAWQVNLPVISASLNELGETPLAAEECFAGSTLFLRGEKSNFVPDRDLHTITRHFPVAKVITLPDTGHNPHIEKRELLLEHLTAFIGASVS